MSNRLEPGAHFIALAASASGLPDVDLEHGYSLAWSNTALGGPPAKPCGRQASRRELRRFAAAAKQSESREPRSHQAEGCGLRNLHLIAHELESNLGRDIPIGRIVEKDFERLAGQCRIECSERFEQRDRSVKRV